jgi:hypothetical protein
LTETGINDISFQMKRISCKPATVVALIVFRVYIFFFHVKLSTNVERFFGSVVANKQDQTTTGRQVAGQ